MSLLRQWQLLEAVVIPALGMVRPAERLIVWNLGCIEDAVAVVLAHLHVVPLAARAEIDVYHSGEPPPRQPLEWGLSELRGVPRSSGLEPVAGHRSRWAPGRDLLDAVKLCAPPGPVDLLVAGHPDPRGWNTAAARVRSGGLVLLPGPPDRPPGDGWEGVGPGGRLLRKLTPATGAPRARAVDDGPVTTLALQQDRARLAQSYTNLARSLARRFSHRGERVEDLEQVALLALIKAADRFEPERERPFAAYAASCIVGELKRHFRDKLWAVRVPRSLQELYLAMKSARDELTQTLQASPTLAQISEFLSVPEEDLLLAMDASTNCWGASLDEPTTADGEGRGAELGDRDSRLERTLDRQVLRQSVEDLAPTERLLLKLVFFEQRTQREVAQEFGVSQMQISRLMHKTLGKMRTTFQPA